MENKHPSLLCQLLILVVLIESLATIVSLYLVN